MVERKMERETVQTTIQGEYGDAVDCVPAQTNTHALAESGRGQHEGYQAELSADHERSAGDAPYSGNLLAQLIGREKGGPEYTETTCL
jgi:hypothetical protein